MQFSRVLLAMTPKAPFPKSGKQFDSLFVTPRRPKKAWDGQDKDAFFREKYAHVHAKQLKRKQQEQEEAAKRGRTRKAEPRPLDTRTPRADFAKRHQALLEKDRTLEFVYGTNAVRAVLANRPVQKVLTGMQGKHELDPEILRLCTEREVPIEANVPQQHLNIMTNSGVHNKIVAQTRKRELPRVTSLVVEDHNLVVNGIDRLRCKLAERKLKVPLGIYIDQVTDTHNMGALLRSACWFGVDFVAYSARNSAPLSPAVVKASSGASEFTEILEVAHPLRLFDGLKKDGWSIVASAPNPETIEKHDLSLETVAPEVLREKLAALGQPVLLVVGSEGEGVRTSLLQRSTHASSLSSPQQKIDSLNVSVATALLLNSIA